MRTEERRNWLEKITRLGETAYGSMDSLYQELFSALLKVSGT